jgi:hypothetical protein
VEFEESTAQALLQKCQRFVARLYELGFLVLFDCLLLLLKRSQNVTLKFQAHSNSALANRSDQKVKRSIRDLRIFESQTLQRTDAMLETLAEQT